MAEWLKHQTVNLGYVGSSPTVPANIKLMQQINTYAELRKLKLNMKTVEDLTELNKIKLNQLFKYINNYIFQAIRSKKHFYCFDNKKNIGCNLYKIGRACSLVCIKSKEENF